MRLFMNLGSMKAIILNRHWDLLIKRILKVLVSQVLFRCRPTGKQKRKKLDDLLRCFPVPGHLRYIFLMVNAFTPRAVFSMVALHDCKREKHSKQDIPDAQPQGQHSALHVYTSQGMSQPHVCTHYTEHTLLFLFTVFPAFSVAPIVDKHEQRKLGSWMPSP